jgi:hypothetical protein
MSQSEVLRILLRLGGRATIDELADEYNIEHFPRNHNFCELPIFLVKKTMSHDITKLLRDHMIHKEKIKRPVGYLANGLNKPLIVYTLTSYGKSQLEEFITN